jgi:hypothetical protein
VPEAAAPKISSTDDFWALFSVMVAGEEGCSRLDLVRSLLGSFDHIVQLLTWLWSPGVSEPLGLVVKWSQGLRE